jgi:hypothetical protein
MSLYHTQHVTEYPKKKYAPMGGAVMVHSKAEEDKLGAGWTDHEPPRPIAKPAKAKKDEPAKKESQ